MNSARVAVWRHADDVRRIQPERMDSPVLAETCVGYLTEFHRDKFLGDSRELARRATREVQAARMQGLLKVRSESELQRRIERQEQTIARLLAFVPARVASLSTDRMHAILEELITFATEISPNMRVLGSAVEETDPDTVACHRVYLSIMTNAPFDPIEFARREFAIQQFAANRLTTEEYQAIRIIVEPRATASLEPRVEP